MRAEQVPDAFETIDTDERPGEPLHPARTDEGTPTDGGNHPVTKGETLAVYVEVGSDLALGRLDVFDDDEGDLIAVPEGVHPAEADEVFRIGSKLRNLNVGVTYTQPAYDADDGRITTSLNVRSFGVVANIREVRNLGGHPSWKPPQSDSGL